MYHQGQFRSTFLMLLPGPYMAEFWQLLNSVICQIATWKTETLAGSCVTNLKDSIILVSLSRNPMLYLTESKRKKYKTCLDLRVPYLIYVTKKMHMCQVIYFLWFNRAPDHRKANATWRRAVPWLAPSGTTFKRCSSCDPATPCTSPGTTSQLPCRLWTCPTMSTLTLALSTSGITSLKNKLWSRQKIV